MRRVRPAITQALQMVRESKAKNLLKTTDFSAYQRFFGTRVLGGVKYILIRADEGVELNGVNIQIGD